MLIPIIAAQAPPDIVESTSGFSCIGQSDIRFFVLKSVEEKFSSFVLSCTRRVAHDPGRIVTSTSPSTSDPGREAAATLSVETIALTQPPVATVIFAAPAAAMAKVTGSIALYSELATRVGLAHGVDPLLLMSIIHVESRGNPAALSRAGARGLMQVMPATGARFGVSDPHRALHDPAINVTAGTRYLRFLADLFGGRPDLMLAAYNAGEGAVLRHGRAIPPYPETRAYVRQVLDRYALLKATTPPD